MFDDFWLKLWGPFKEVLAYLWSAIKSITGRIAWKWRVARHYEQSVTQLGALIYKRKPAANAHKHPEHLCPQCFKARDQQGMTEKQQGLDYCFVCQKCEYKAPSRPLVLKFS